MINEYITNMKKFVNTTKSQTRFMIKLTKLTINNKLKI